MFRKLVVLLFLVAILSCHAEEYAEDQQDVVGGEVSEETEATDLADRMLNPGKGDDMEKAGAVGDLVKTDEAAVKQMNEDSEKLIKQGEDPERSFGNALDVIKTDRAAYVCGTRKGRRRCLGRSHCCPRKATGCCANDCCSRRYRFCSRLGFCANRFGLSRCRFAGGSTKGTRCSSRVCCALRSRYNRCGAFSLSFGRTLVACMDRSRKVSCGTPPTPGTVCRTGRCCRTPLRCCLFGCCR